VGNRWTGTLNSVDRSAAVTTPLCPPNSGSCSCDGANADPSSYSDVYKQWLLTNAQAQMSSFELGWGWFYWTWVTESAVQWSWKAGMDAGILPKKTWDRNFNCSSSVPDFNGLPETY
jgi:glucan 1,3-beta-glucosidase